MSREIKFRAWHKKERVMLKPNDAFGTTRDLDCVIYYAQGQPVELMQYTGLKDMNGVKIYEGDIVNLIPDGYIQELATVEWDDDNASYIYRRISPLELVNGEGIFVKWKPVEVIGNIYSNPELMGGK